MRAKYLLLTSALISIVGLVGGQERERGQIPSPGIGATTAPKYAMEVTGAKHVVGVWQIRVYTTNFPAAEWMISFPVASDLPRQTGAKTALTPNGELLKESSPAQRPFLSLRVRPVDGITEQSLSLAVRYEATLLARKMVSVRGDSTGSPPSPLGTREKGIYSASTPTLDFRSEPFQAWLENHNLRRGESEDEVDFGRRVFSTMLQTFHYKDGVPINAASKVCNLAELDCDTLSVVFVSAMRANQVSARVLFAWPAKTIRAGPKGIISGHAQAEFFASGVGWVPVDVARALTARSAGRDPARHFGEDDGTHLVAQVDPDYILKSPVGPMRVNSMHPGPDVWTRGAPKKADVRFLPQGWEVKVQELPLRH